MTRKAWDGRFKKQTDPIVERFSASIDVDARLAQADIEGSLAHAQMLQTCGILTDAEHEAIAGGLRELAEEFSRGEVILDPACEDIHMLIERRLTEKIGESAGKLHTGRSRNDQVALDLRLWCRDTAGLLDTRLGSLQTVLLGLAQKHAETLLPGYTHLQRAQPVTLAHHLLAYFWMFHRDRSRLADWKRRANYSPLGAAAMAGTSLPNDREMTARTLGFDGPIVNSMDAVSDRDFVAELVFSCSLTMTHLSRMAEEAVLWSTAEFGFLTLDDSVATGSSIMPQKKNPDVAELTRGKFGRVQGDLVALLSLLKALPLSYMRDLQEDKPPLFDAVDSTLACLEAMQRMLETSTFNTAAMRRAADDGFATATDLAEYLVRQGLAFRQAHEVVGKLVARCLDEGRRLDELTTDELVDAHPLLKSDSAGVLNTQASVQSRTLTGGPSPEAVHKQIEAARAALKVWES
ncbi:MAG: argininosuccinate lyase [Armatimonadetes bacterium]|nr:argininosuccinate lyase [Armatimonadota bacterium]